jgi:small acid-soluble spore protein (thioredoxin-like protein)
VITLAKPDNRADNKAHLQEHIDHTIANLHEAKAYLDEHTSEITDAEKQVIEAKNDRRQESIKGFVAEKKDEAQQ